MKKYVFAIIFCCVTLVGLMAFKGYESDVRMIKQESLSTQKIVDLVDAQGHPSKDLLTLLAVLSVKHDATLANIVQETQKQWIRPKGKERWEIDNTFEETYSYVMPLMHKLGYVYEVAPTKKQYDYALLLGGSLNWMRSRIAYLIKQWKAGVRFNNVIVLTGERKLSKEVDSLDSLLDRDNQYLPIRKDWVFDGNYPEMETGLLKLLIDQTEFPEGLNKNEIVIVDTPGHTDQNGTFHRATTATTVHEWMKHKPKPGTCMVVSNQPYVSYQHAVLKALLPKEFEIETVGEEMRKTSSSARVGTLLDNTARLLYVEHMKLSNQIEKI